MRSVPHTLSQVIGNTPILGLPISPPPGDRRVYLKLESLNLGGSHKARIAAAMVDYSEQAGELQPGSGQMIVAPTGGNTGLGLAMFAAARGYRIVLAVPANYSAEKRRRLHMYGADVRLAHGPVSDNPHGRLAIELHLANPGSVLLDQASHPANPQAHRETTAAEILATIDVSRLRYMVAGIGTGGHITGIGQVLKRANPNLTVVGVQPDGCDVLHSVFVSHDIQGLAVGITPANLDATVVDSMESVSTREAIQGALVAMRDYGLSVGLSSGANLAVSRRLAPRLAAGQDILTFIYDGAEDYMTQLASFGRVHAGVGLFGR